MQTNEIDIGNCVEVIRGSNKGLIGVVIDFEYENYAVVRVVLDGKRDFLPIHKSNLRKC